MSMPNKLKFVANVLETFQYQPSPGGLLRIAGWTFLFLVLISVALTRPTVLPKADLVHMDTGPNDLRWVRDDFDLFPKGKDLNVAWLSGSSIVIKNGDNLPQRVQQLMSSDEGVPTRAFVYSVSARRTLDTYTMVQDALERKPDVMVLVINPFWVFNSKAVFNKQNLFNHAAKLWWNESDWLWQFTLTAPANHLYNLLGRHIPIIADRHHYVRYARKESRKLFGVSLIPEAVRPQKKPGNTALKFSQSLQFWLLFKKFNGDIEQFFPKGRSDPMRWQLAAISQADTDLSSWPVEIMHQMLSKIRDSGVRTLLYVAPISPQMRGMGSRNGYNAVLNTMQDLKGEYENEKLRFIVNMPKNITDSIEHRDYLHLREPGELPTLISKQLSELVSTK